MPKSEIVLLRHQIDDSQHDIESIGIYIDKQDQTSISTEQVSRLRGLQKMYRDRILVQQSEILASELRTKSNTLAVSTI